MQRIVAIMLVLQLCEANSSGLLQQFFACNPGNSYFFISG